MVSDHGAVELRQSNDALQCSTLDYSLHWVGRGTRKFVRHPAAKMQNCSQRLAAPTA